MAYEKLPTLDGRHNPGLCCPSIPAQAPLDKVIAVGFGAAHATCDGELVADGEQGFIVRDGCHVKTDDWIRFADIEAMAAIDPDRDWRIALHGPMHGEVYQRQGANEWMLVEKDDGFA